MLLRSLLCLSLWLISAELPAAEITYQLVLENGRVMDPASGLNALRNVGITDGKILAMSEQKLTGEETLDVSGLVVAPGFIDFHAHGQDNTANRLQALDGVTTALDLEGGRFPVAEYYQSRAGQAVLNYGVAVSHHGIRRTLWPTEQHDDDWAYEEAGETELTEILARFDEGLADGGIGAGLGLEYTPGVGYDEVYRIFRFMADNHAPVTVHVRRARGKKLAPHINIAAIQEVLANAASTGAALHIVHITPSALGDTKIVLDMLQNALAAGVNVSTEVYPYMAGSTSLSSAAFDEGWQERLGMSFENLVWTATGERLTEKTFEEYRSRGQLEGSDRVIAHFIPEAAMQLAVAHPMTHIASDGLPWENGGEHPRGSGTYSRVLGRHVREMEALDLMTALAKMSSMPAQRLAAYVPAMKNKGKLAPMADADITVFDASTVIDRATFDEPMLSSTGIIHVLVNGEFVVRAGKSVEGAYPGKPVRLRQ